MTLVVACARQQICSPAAALGGRLIVMDCPWQPSDWCLHETEYRADILLSAQIQQFAPDSRLTRPTPAGRLHAGAASLIPHQLLEQSLCRLSDSLRSQCQCMPAMPASNADAVMWTPGQDGSE